MQSDQAPSRSRTARCRCGQLRITCEGEPARVSICHCLVCKQRSGSAFTAQARWPVDRSRQEGAARSWTSVGDSGSSTTFDFCPTCGDTLTYRSEALPGLVAVAMGCFPLEDWLVPDYSVYEERKLPWVEILGDEIERID